MLLKVIINKENSNFQGQNPPNLQQDKINKYKEIVNNVLNDFKE